MVKNSNSMYQKRGWKMQYIKVLREFLRRIWLKSSMFRQINDKIGGLGDNFPVIAGRFFYL